MFLMDKFFNGAYMTFGMDVMSWVSEDQEERDDPIIAVFPRMTKCTFHMYGRSGDPERHDALCILPLNIVNEKIYIFLWFWFLVLSVLTVLQLLFRILTIISTRMRTLVLVVRFRVLDRDTFKIIVKRSLLGDWFLIYMLGLNMDTLIFKEIIGDLGQRLMNNHIKELYDT